MLFKNKQAKTFWRYLCIIHQVKDTGMVFLQMLENIQLARKISSGMEWEPIKELLITKFEFSDW